MSVQTFRNGKFPYHQSVNSTNPSCAAMFPTIIGLASPHEPIRNGRADLPLRRRHDDEGVISDDRPPKRVTSQPWRANPQVPPMLNSDSRALLPEFADERVLLGRGKLEEAGKLFSGKERDGHVEPIPMFRLEAQDPVPDFLVGKGALRFRSRRGYRRRDRRGRRDRLGAGTLDTDRSRVRIRSRRPAVLLPIEAFGRYLRQLEEHRLLGRRSGPAALTRADLPVGTVDLTQIGARRTPARSGGAVLGEIGEP